MSLAASAAVVALDRSAARNALDTVRQRGQSCLIVTERAVFAIDGDGSVLTEHAPGFDVRGEVLDLIPFDVRVSRDLELE